MALSKSGWADRAMDCLSKSCTLCQCDPCCHISAPLQQPGKPSKPDEESSSTPRVRGQWSQKLWSNLLNAIANSEVETKYYTSTWKARFRDSGWDSIIITVSSLASATPFWFGWRGKKSYLSESCECTRFLAGEDRLRKWLNAVPCRRRSSSEVAKRSHAFATAAWGCQW